MRAITWATVVCRYAFQIQGYFHNAATNQAMLTVKNVGVAPAYHDMFVAVGGERSVISLKRLQPGSQISVLVDNVPSPGEVCADTGDPPADMQR
jgi:hypothetical protein